MGELGWIKKKAMLYPLSTCKGQKAMYLLHLYNSEKNII